MLFLRQSTASQEILLGPFVDSTDGNTAETGLTIANTDIKIWVEGATTEANKNSGGATHIASGRYYAVLDATDTATVGKMEINVHVSGALPVRREFQVLEEAVYDALFASSAAGYQVPIWASAGSTVNLSSTTVGTVSTASDLGSTALTKINTECDTALSDYGALKPTTAGRTLDVTATGAAGIDWGNVENQASTVILSGTSVSFVDATDVCNDAFVTAVGGDAINALSITADAGTEIATAVWALGTRTLTANTNLSIPTAADIRSAVGLASANLDTQIGDLPTSAELATALTTSLTTAMTEGYRGTGATGSVRDLLYEIIAHMGESTISSTTKTLKKLDGSTAKTYTLNSATTPTSITETT